MAKSIIAILLIIALTSFGVVYSFGHTERTVKEYTKRLERAYLNPRAEELRRIAEEWDTDKSTLMLIINHRDVEEVSESMIRAYEEALAGRYEMAVEEIAIAKFQLEELVERERFSFENIF